MSAEFIGRDDAVQSTRVLIVAKTRMRHSACIGGIAEDGRSLRLLAPPNAFAHFNIEYEVGDVWRISFTRPSAPVAPHTEDVVVGSRKRLGQANDLLGSIQRHVPPVQGGVDILFDGLAQYDAPRTLLYVAERTGIPSFSTQFWQPDRPLRLIDRGSAVRYRYGDEGPELSFVGFQEPAEIIPAGTLVRVSAARWWRPEERPDMELRCHLQVSGWFADQELSAADSSTATPVRPTTERTPESLLHSVFGYPEFRPHQAEIIESILHGQDALAVMPTGGGKSLCYQLPALLFEGLTVVVSPLISLMQDQVDQLRSLGIAAAYLNSSLDIASELEVRRRCRQGEIKLLYVAPETLLRNETLFLLQQSRPAFLAIDEAHCISEWGPDFRPEYQRIVEARARFPGVVCLALTATATERVRQDIVQRLELRDAQTFVAGFDRDNLFLRVTPRGDGLAQALNFLRERPDQPGIIYCSTRKTVDDLTAILVANGVVALPYHAGLDAETRQTNQRRFIRDDAQVIVATIAFGMGIDKSNVRFVLHYNLPQDVESYYQEIGRAGRDGLPSDCLLLYSRADAQTIRRFIEQGADDEKAGRTRRLDAMIRWAESNTCRRRLLLAYFEEEYPAENCGKCDICVAPVTPDEELDDLTQHALLFLRCVRATRETFGPAYIIKILLASREQDLIRRGHHQLDVYGSGSAYSRSQWNELADQFLHQSLVVRDLEYGSLQLTAQGRAVLGGAKVFGLLRSRHRAPTPTSPAGAHDPALFDRLRALRRRLAQEANLPPYIVFSDRTLIEMATYFPQSRLSFAALHGVGEHKMETYADSFLHEITAYCQEQGIAEVPRHAARTQGASQSSESPRPVRVNARRQGIVDAFLASESLQETADALNLQPRTIVGHLESHVLQDGHTLPLSLLLRQSTLDSEQRSEVIAVFVRTGTEYLRPVYEEMHETVSYDELRLLRLCAVLMERQGAAVADA